MPVTLVYFNDSRTPNRGHRAYMVQHTDSLDLRDRLAPVLDEVQTAPLQLNTMEIAAVEGPDFRDSFFYGNPINIVDFSRGGATFPKQSAIAGLPVWLIYRPVGMPKNSYGIHCAMVAASDTSAALQQAIGLARHLPSNLFDGFKIVQLAASSSSEFTPTLFDGDCGSLRGQNSVGDSIENTPLNVNDLGQYVRVNKFNLPYGEFSQLTPMAPAQVFGLVVTPGNTQNTVSWTVPSSNGSPITDFVIEVDSGSGFSTIADGVSTSNTFTHTGLANGTAYTYRVSAVNAIGTGPVSATVQGTPSAAPAVPDQVTGLVVTPGDSQNDLVWVAPADNGAAITDYIIEVDSGGGFATLSDGVNSGVSFSHTGLTNGTSYTYRVAAVNSVGTGPVSAVSSGTPVSSLAPFTTAIWGQSEHQHILNQFDDVLTPEALVAQNMVTFWWHDRVTAGAGGVQSVTLNDATVAAGTQVTAAMVAMGNVFMRNLPGQAIKIVMHTVSGTSPTEIMDDTFTPSGTPRGWENDWALHNAAIADGHNIDHPWHSWFAAPGSWGSNYGQNMFTFIKGRDHVTGALLTYSEASPLDVNGIMVHRTLRDLYTHEPVWIANSGSHVFIPTDDLLNATTLSGGGSEANLSNKQASTESWRAVIRNAALSSHFGPEVFPINAYANGFDNGDTSWADQAHPTGLIDAGINRMSRLIAHAILRGADVTSYEVPEITNSEWQPDGSYMEFWSTAGSITTPRGGTGPGSTYPHWTDVLGVQIDGAPAQRAEIQPNGRVRVYPNSGSFTSSSVITFGEGGASGWIQHDEDAFAGLWDDYPVVNLGLTDVPGIPLKPLPDPAVLTSTIVGTASFQTSDAGPNFRDPNTVPASTTSLTFHGIATVDSDSAQNSPDLISINGLYLDFGVVVSQQRVRLSADDNGNTNHVNNVTTASNTITTGVQHEYLLKVDLVAGRAQVYLDGASTPIIDETWTPNAGQEFFPTSRRIEFLGTTQFKGSVERLRVWLNEATLDNSIPTSTPYKEIAGSAATVNADSWKQDADAT